MGIKTISISFYRNKCIGCGNCCLCAPQTWVMDENDGKSILKNGINKKTCFNSEISAIDLEENKKAEKGCPARCIQVGG